MTCRVEVDRPNSLLDISIFRPTPGKGAELTGIPTVTKIINPTDQTGYNKAGHFPIRGR